MKIDRYLEFITEKRIDQIASRLDVKYSFDIIKTKHADIRRKFHKRGLEGFNQNPISNAEMSEFVRFFIKNISEKIAIQDIVDNTEFIIKSESRELAMAIIARRVRDNYWKLIIKTVFRESAENRFRTQRGQLVLEK